MNKLDVIKDDIVTIEDKNYFNDQIDIIINQHKDNRQTINRLVFDSIACLTDADRASNTLANKGFFKRLIGNFTGSNKKLEIDILNNRGKAQYLAQQTLQKLAEQNLLSFDLISAVNNKLNNHIEMVNNEFEQIYEGLNKFFRLYQSNLLQIELRLNNLERNVNLLTWASSIEYQMFNEVPYLELDKLSKIICITRDFYEITKGDWSTSELLVLKSVLSQLSLSPSDEINLWEEIGYTSKTPRWAIAYKFPAHQVSTVLNDVTWQVGRTGKLTPVAELEEVELSGSKVKRASLHNISEIQRKDIRIGDRVFIEKAAEIIPQVVKAIKEERTGNEKTIEEPINCPVCNHKLEREEGLVDIKCVNEECPAKIQGEIEYFVSRDALNIMGLGSKIVEKFIDLGYIKTVVDIYDLKNHREELENIDKMGKRSIENLLNSIEESKNREYDKVIYALGIPFIGKVASKVLAKASKNIDKLMSMTFEELTSIEGIGEIAANEIIAFFKKEKTQKLVAALKEKGLKFEITESETKVENLNPNFAGKNFLFTGTLKHFTREQIKEEIEKLGGKNLSSVSKNLDYLIVGEKAGSKLKKAQEIPTIKILTEEEFIELKDKFD